jgi:hypothetical protein
VDGAKEVPHRAYADRLLVPLGLYDYLPAEDWTWVIGHAVNTTVSRGSSLPRLEPHLLEQVGDQSFELGGLQLHEVRPVVQAGDDVGFFNKPGVDH